MEQLVEELDDEDVVDDELDDVEVGARLFFEDFFLDRVFLGTMLFVARFVLLLLRHQYELSETFEPKSSKSTSIQTEQTTESFVIISA